MYPKNTDASKRDRRCVQLVLETTEDSWRATEHGTEIGGIGRSVARAAEDYCRRVAEASEAPAPAEPTEGSA